MTAILEALGLISLTYITGFLIVFVTDIRKPNKNFRKTIEKSDEEYDEIRIEISEKIISVIKAVFWPVVFVLRTRKVYVSVKKTLKKFYETARYYKNRFRFHLLRKRNNCHHWYRHNIKRRIKQ